MKSLLALVCVLLITLPPHPLECRDTPQFETLCELPPMVRMRGVFIPPETP